jgi:hypothetical protein
MRIAMAYIGWRMAIAAAATAVWLCVPDDEAPTVAELPPWFGDAHLPARHVAGTVIGADRPMTVRLLLDVPDPTIWPGLRVQTTTTGAFDFGPLRPGAYLVFTQDGRKISRVLHANTLRDPDEPLELFVYDRDAIPEHAWENDDYGERESFWWTRSFYWPDHLRSWLGPEDPAVFGIVLAHDGTPASNVGVQFVSCASSDHDRARPWFDVATTTQSGSFRVRGTGAAPCGFQIWLGPTLHEVRFNYDFRRLKTNGFVIQLPPPGQEAHQIFDDGTYPWGDSRGAWIRGRVVRDGRGVADAGVSAYVLPFDNMEHHDHVRTRSDGSFELYIASNDLEREAAVMMSADQPIAGLAGRRVVRLRPGESREDFVVEVGTGAKVFGTVVDTHGVPIPDVHVGCLGEYRDRAWTGIDGSFELVVRLQGRCRLHAFVERSYRTLGPANGIEPKLDIAHLDEVHRDLRLVVRPNSYGAYLHEGDVDLGARFDGDGVVWAIADELEATASRR